MHESYYIGSGCDYCGKNNSHTLYYQETPIYEYNHSFCKVCIEACAGKSVVNISRSGNLIFEVGEISHIYVINNTLKY